MYDLIMTIEGHIINRIHNGVSLSKIALHG